MRCGLSLSRHEDVAKRILLWLEANESWLLIIDNLDDVEVICGYLPLPKGSGHTIITTRNTKTDGIPASGLEVREMDRDSAVSLLLGRIQAVHQGAEIHAEAYRIVEILGGLPLAIEQAAGYIKVPENISKYRPVFQQSRRQLLGRRLPGNHIYSRTVATTWQLSFERLEKTCPNPVTLLQYFAFMNPDEILVDYLRAGATALPQSLQELIGDPFEWGEVIDALEESSLIRVSARDTKFSIHRLLQAVIHDGLESGKRRFIQSILLKLGLTSFPILHDDRKERDRCQRFRSQVIACLDHTKSTEPNPSWTTLAERMANYLYLEGLYTEASGWWSTLFLIQQESLGEEHPETLGCMHQLARSLDQQGRSREALTLNKDTLAARKWVLGPEHPDTLASMNRLAISYDNVGEVQKSKDLYVETLKLRKKVLGTEHPDTLWSMNNLGASYCRSYQYNVAAELNGETFNLRKRVLGPEHPDTLLSTYNLGNSYADLGRFQEAADLIAETLVLGKKVRGPEHPETLESMNGLAVAYENLGQLQKSADLNLETLVLRKKVLGPEHPHTMLSLSNLAYSYKRLGRIQEAAVLDAELLHVRTKVLGSDHPDTLKSRRNVRIQRGAFNPAHTSSWSICGVRGLGAWTPDM